MNSIHLDFSRREEYRRAREVLLTARGNQTVQIEAEALQEARQQIKDNLFGTNEAPPAKPPAVPGKRDSEPQLLINRDQKCALHVGYNTIGRLPDNDVVVSDPMISRRHCAILVHSTNNCEVHDMASKNGTFVNGVRITSPTRLRAGDKLQVGDIHMVLSELGNSEIIASPSSSGKTSIIVQPKQT